jgi:putative PEP-CTERM system histidine kinase
LDDAVTGGELSAIGIWSYGLAACAFLALAVRLVYGWRPGLRAALLLAAVVCTAIWAAAGVVLFYRPGPPAWLGLAYLDVARYALWFFFLGSLLQGTEPSFAGMWRAAFPKWAVILGTLGLLASLVVLPAPPIADVVASAAGIVGFAVRLGLAILGLILIEQLIRRAEPSARWALKPLCVGLAGVFAFDLYFYASAILFEQLDADLWVARGAANALVIPFLVVATARNPGLAVGMHVSRGAVFHSTAVVVAGVVLLLIASAGYLVRFVGGGWGRALQIQFLFFSMLAGVLVVSSGKFRAKLRVFVSKHFFSYRYDYREEWLRFTRTLADATGLRNVQEQTIKALADLVESPAGGLWLRRDDRTFRLESRLNMPVPDAAESADGSLPTFLERTSWVIDIAEYTGKRSRYVGLELPEWLLAMPSAWLVVPLLAGTELIGFAVLAKSRVAVEMNWEVRDLLKVASRQAATYLGQVRATEALVEARKFEAFNRMSAFVVHDLKNLIAQLSLMLKNAERHRDNPEFQRDMLETVEHVVGRMHQLMLQLRTGATPLGKPRLVNLETLVRAVCAARGAEQSRIELDLSTAVALGHEDRLDHVIGHLIQNATDATALRGKVRVRAYREGDFAVVEVADTGVGMDAEFVRDRLFKPFETNKPTGMGIGVYESAQYVSALGGRILYDSTPMVGTRVRVLLPTGESSASVPHAEAMA